jgi:hypothetical protein
MTSLHMTERAPVATHRGWLWGRRILSILAGLAAGAALSIGTDAVLENAGVLPSGALYDTGLLLLAIAYRSAYAVLGSYIAARLAPDRRMAHALALGVLDAVAFIVGAVVTRDMGLGPAWYSLTLAALALPCAWCGGRLLDLGMRNAPST